MYMDDEGITLATEIFKELKASAKRWFIAFLVMLCLEFATVASFIWYISLPTDESVTSQVAEDVDNDSIVTQHIGGDYNDGTPDDDTKAESDTQ